MNKQKVKDISSGDNFSGVLLIKSANLMTTKSGNLYMDLELVDSTGRIKAKYWDATRETAEDLKDGSFALFRGFVDKFRDELQLKIDNYSIVNEKEIDITAFMPVSRFPIEDMVAYLHRIGDSLGNSYLRKFWALMLDDKIIMQSFVRCPAAVSYHHVFLGGLLEHTCEVIRLGDAIAAIRPELDRDLLLSGALLHDLGKIAEYSSGPAFTNLDEGLLLSHLYIGAEMIDRLVSEIEDFPPDISAMLKHLVLSHHGTREFGSPVEPCFAEAVVLHYIDNIDAKINNIRTTINEDAGSEGEMFTSQQSRMLKRRILRTTLRPEPDGYNPFAQTAEKETPKEESGVKGKGEEPKLW